MSTAKLRLSDAAAEFLARKKFAHSTEVNYRSLFNLLTDSIGSDIYLQNLTLTHVERFLARYDTVSSGNLRISQLRTFLSWCQRNEYVKRNVAQSLEKRRDKREGAVVKHRIPLDEWPRILEIADSQHPLNRITVACGLYLGQRGRELTAIRISDLHRDPTGRVVSVRVNRTKVQHVAEVPVFEELADEIDRWLAWYGARHGDAFGNLPPNAYLLPRRKRVVSHAPEGGFARVDRDTDVDPFQPLGRPYKVVQQVLKEAGWYKRGEGAHTLRRSLAVSMYKADLEDGYSGAIQNVAAMLGHASVKTTETYLGTSLSEERLRDRVAGKRLSPRADTANVVEFRRDHG